MAYMQLVFFFFFWRRLLSHFFPPDDRPGELIKICMQKHLAIVFTFCIFPFKIFSNFISLFPHMILSYNNCTNPVHRRKDSELDGDY